MSTIAVSESLRLPMDFAFVPIGFHFNIFINFLLLIDEDTHFFRANIFDKLRRKEFKRDVSILLV